MRKHDRIVIQLSVEILGSATEKARDCVVQTEAVRLALRCLLPHCPERWPLTSFWNAAGWVGKGRHENVSASYNGILHQLRRSGALAPCDATAAAPR